MAHIRVVNGPNLNLLGKREPDHYGRRSLAEIMQQCEQFTADCGHAFSHIQSNAENELIDAIQSCPADGVDYIVINPAAFTHTSVALRDALLAVEIPFVEVHLSNVHAREDFRRHSYFSDIALAVVAGFAGDSYLLAIQGLINRLEPET